MQDAEGRLSDAAAVLVVAERAAVGARLESVVGGSGRLLPLAADWDAAAATVAGHGRLAAVLADCAGLEDAAVPARLSVLAAAAQDAAIPLVVGFEGAQLELVGGQLVGGETTLLCDPDPVDWAAALALATAPGGLDVRDHSFDEERYRRLSAEVARIADALAQLIRPEPATEQQQPKGDDYVSEPPRGYGARPTEIDPAEVRRAIRARRLRDEVFAQPGLFEDPAWDMLLDLFAAELERRPVSVSSLCIAAAVPATTALRWITKLIAAGLLERRPDSLDRRRAFISLSTGASAALREYVMALRRAGLTLG